MTLDNNQTEIIITPRLEKIMSKLKSLEDQKEQICEEIQNILATAKLSGFDTNILKEILEIHKVQRESSIPKDGVNELYSHLLKWKNNKENFV